MEDEEEDQDDEWDLDCLTVRLSKKDKQRILKLWKQTLIVKLLGRSIGYHHLLKKSILHPIRTMTTPYMVDPNWSLITI